MKNIIRHNGSRALIGGWLALVFSLPANALTLADSPLFLTTAVKPNIMLMLDNSGSMNNIVPESPYDASTTYLATCPSSNLIPAGSNVEIRIVSSKPKIKFSGSEYEFGATSATEKCFDSAASYKAKLNADLGTAPSSYLGAQYKGNFLNWYFNPNNTSPTWSAGEKKKPGTQSRLEIAQIAATGLVDTLSSNVRVGFSTYNSGDGGSLREIMEDVTIAKKTSVKGKINALTPVGTTPLAETLADIGRYFTTGYSGNLTLTKHPAATTFTKTVDEVFNGHSIKNDSGATLASPIQYSCQQSFALLLTDGRPQSDQNISSYLCDYDGDSGTCASYDKKTGRSYESAGSDYLDDVAQALFEIDLRPDLTKTGTQKNNIVTYMIGFADEDAISDPLMKEAAKQGGGEFLTAENASELSTVFNETLSSIVSRTSSAAAVATNSTRLNTDTLVYQARFNSGDWSGQIIAYPLESDGSLGAAKWDTDTSEKIPPAASRNIFTFNVVTKTKVTFESAGFTGLDATQQAALNAPDCSVTLTGDACGKARIDWLRGDATQEVKNKGPFRDRVKPLGDVVNSDPLFVGADNYGYVKLGDSDGGGPKYIDFLTWKQTREGMLFVGANDGMMHAFVASTGVEKFAYVPRGVYQNLSALTQPGYTHKYFVDGPSTSADARIGGTTETEPRWGWRTILVGTLGAGGRGVFALDITDPSASDYGKPLWEVTSADTGFEELGYVMGAPQIVKLSGGKWVAIFGNGYNSKSNKAMLFIVDLATGELITPPIDTGSALTPNGLSAPAVYDGNESRDIGDSGDAIYAGDLLGNVWKFINSSGWKIAYKSGSTSVPLFSAKDGASKPQPITAPLEIGERPTGTSSGVMVYIGTGSYFTTDDRVNKDVQSLYGIWDNGSTTTRGELQDQAITHEFTAFGEQLRVVSNKTVDYSASGKQRGWYLDLISPVLGKQGERVVSTPLLRHGRVIFTTLIPSTEACSFGGTSWLMEMTATTGGRLDYSVFDLEKDNLFNEKDFVTVTIDGKSVKVPASGAQSKVGITKAPAVVSAGSIEYKVASGTDTSGASKGVQVTKEKGTGGKPRTSWKQLFPEDK